LLPEIQGFVEAGWGAVEEAFHRNFELHGELGAACCVYVEGRPTVDLWGGIADSRSGRAWHEDTVAVVFSTTKGTTAICAHILVERGLLDLDAPVAEYWPEFAAGGKRELRVRWLLSHQAGLPTIELPLTLEEACAWKPVISALERQQPLWEPGTLRAYHALTYGFLVGEVVRRVTGRSLGRFFADEIATPLNLSAWIGTPEEVEPRVAHLVPPVAVDSDAIAEAWLALVPESVPVPAAAKEALKAMLNDPESVGARARRLGNAFPDGLVTEAGAHNSRIVRASEHPGSGMVSDARSLARMYAATIGEVDGRRLLESATVEAMCVNQPSRPYGVPAELEEFVATALPSPTSLGFFRPSHVLPMLGPRSFGHAGYGGSLAFADPGQNVGFGYVMNHIANDSRASQNLVDAVASCLA
jgi:CubicO group peptidase (beta-lactamase class C family)